MGDVTSTLIVGIHFAPLSDLESGNGGVADLTREARARTLREAPFARDHHGEVYLDTDALPSW
jgi:hypothetical protein